MKYDDCAVPPVFTKIYFFFNSHQHMNMRWSKQLKENKSFEILWKKNFGVISKGS